MRDKKVKRLKHNLLPLVGRSTSGHRSETRLELFFDLTMVTAFWVASSQLSSFVTKGYWQAGVAGFLIAMLALIIAWMSYTWFSSAFDNCDWLFKVVTMMQMVGILVIAIGLPQMFESLKEGEQIDGVIMITGYAIMRVPMIFQWIRVSRHDKQYARKATTYAKSVALSQAGWLALIFLKLPAVIFVPIVLAILVLELGIPIVVEKLGSIPWHPHHLAERLGSLVIIAIGESMFGTIAALSAVTENTGMTLEVVLTGLACVGIAFSMWWIYFALPSGDILEHNRKKGLGWSYTHVILFIAITAVGAGFHNIAYFLEHHSVISSFETFLTFALPIVVFATIIGRLYTYGLHRTNVRDFWNYFPSILVFCSAIALIGLASYRGLGILPSLLITFGLMLIVIVNDEVNVRTRREDKLSEIFSKS